jgi:hypothetical protein
MTRLVGPVVVSIPTKVGKEVIYALPETSFIRAGQLGATIVTSKMAWSNQGHLKATTITF